jgi:hypothetical protein
MKLIKKYFSDWNIARIIRIVLAIFLGISYYYNRESIYLFGTLVLSIQAIFNISCPGGSCSTNYAKTDSPVIKTEKYEPKKQD